MKYISKLREIYRIDDWIPYLGFLIIGITLKKRTLLIQPEIILKLCIFTSFILSYAYSLNDYFDEDVPHKYFLFPLLASIFSLPFLSRLQVIFVISFLFIVTIYSWDKTKIKGMPVIGTLSNTAGFSLIFLIGYYVAGDLNYLGILFLLLLVIYETIAQLIHEEIHMKEDLKSGIKTTVSLIPDKIILLVKTLLSLNLLISLIILLGSGFLLFSLGSIAFSIYFIFRISEVNKRLRKEYRTLGILLGIVYLLTL